MPLITIKIRVQVFNYLTFLEQSFPTTHAGARVDIFSWESKKNSSVGMKLRHDFIRTDDKRESRAAAAASTPTHGHVHVHVVAQYFLMDVTYAYNKRRKKISLSLAPTFLLSAADQKSPNNRFSPSNSFLLFLKCFRSLNSDPFEE